MPFPVAACWVQACWRLRLLRGASAREGLAAVFTINFYYRWMTKLPGHR